MVKNLCWSLRSRVMEHKKHRGVFSSQIILFFNTGGDCKAGCDDNSGPHCEYSRVLASRRGQGVIRGALSLTQLAILCSTSLHCDVLVVILRAVFISFALSPDSAALTFSPSPPRSVILSSFEEHRGQTSQPFSRIMNTESPFLTPHVEYDKTLL